MHAFSLSRISYYHLAMARESFKMVNFVKRCLSNLSPSVSPLQQAALKERCILVDENDRRIGSASKLDCHKVDGGLLLHRAFSVFLFNNCGELLIQKRAESKVTFPSHITNTCCSHPIEDIPNELVEENALGVKLAAIRRLNYELGIPLNEMDTSDFEYLTRIHYYSTGDGIWGEHELDYLLVIRKDVSLNPNLDEVSDVTYVNRSTLQKYVQVQTDPITPWFDLVVRNFLPTWWDNLSNLKKFEDHKNIKKFTDN